jgi:hypothetical protein
MSEPAPTTPPAYRAEHRGNDRNGTSDASRNQFRAWKELMVSNDRPGAGEIRSPEARLIDESASTSGWRFHRRRPAGCRPPDRPDPLDHNSLA